MSKFPLNFPDEKDHPRALLCPLAPPLPQMNTTGTAASAPSGTTPRLSSAPCATSAKARAPGSRGSTRIWSLHNRRKLWRLHHRRRHRRRRRQTQSSSAGTRGAPRVVWSMTRRRPPCWPHSSRTRRSGNRRWPPRRRSLQRRPTQTGLKMMLIYVMYEIETNINDKLCYYAQIFLSHNIKWLLVC